MDVFLIELTHPQVPLQRLMVEAAGPQGAKRRYVEKTASVRKLSSSEALRLARENIPLIEADPDDADEAEGEQAQTNGS